MASGGQDNSPPRLESLWGCPSTKDHTSNKVSSAFRVTVAKIHPVEYKSVTQPW